MKTALQAKTGTVLKIDGDIFLVVRHEMRRGGRGATNVSMRLKNLIQGNMQDRVMDGEDKVDDIILDRSKAEFLYSAGDEYSFMNQDTFETVELHEEDIGDAINYLKEGMIVDLQTFEGKFIGIVLPIRVELEIVECEPTVAGNTADGKVEKWAKLETGMEIKVPGFINQNDIVVVDTQEGKYLERAK